MEVHNGTESVGVHCTGQREFRANTMCTDYLRETGGVVNDRKNPVTAPIIMVELSIEKRRPFDSGFGSSECLSG